MNLREKDNYGQTDTDFQDNTNTENETVPFDNLVTNDINQQPNRSFSNQQDRDDDLDDENDNDLDKNPDEDDWNEDEKLQNERDEKRQDVSGDISLTEDIDQDLEEIDPVNRPRQFSNR
ncbi:hypothetical protein Q1W71_03115 [Flavobacterium pectinovorum]|uniref:hypothetical protein n=1 Tax=Flavobacterium pectinovorum TaxID=29533 RepID=UPI00265EB098|nr:hypothetical protein [Flavobacterium pectinovorum]WKL48778.1 hypothetical protein Q1W71_03115 [Flavobacterium pectinovorum]